MRILVVDDQPEVVSMLIEALSPKHSVIGITGGLNLVEWVTHRGFDLVLLDMLLPDSNGLTLLAELKSACPGVFVILMTGMNTSFTLEQALSAGADHFLRKPIDLRELLDVVKNLDEPRA